MTTKTEVKNLDEAKKRLEKIIKKEKLGNVPIFNDAVNKSKKHNK